MKYLLSLCLVALAAPLWAADSVSSREYTVGVVPQFEQRKLFETWQPILSALEQRTGFRLKLIGSPKIPVFEKKFLAGQYDFAYMNPYHLLKANDSQGYVPLVRDDSRMLKGVLVVAKDSPYEALSDLDGSMIAFPSPNALGASLLMRADLDGQFNLKFTPRYVQTHSSVYLNVALGQTAAGGGVLSTLKKQPEDLQSHLRILYETQGIKPHPLSAHPRVPESDREKMRDAWLALASTAQGQQLMARIPMFQSVSATMDDYTELRDRGLDDYYILD